MDNTIEGNVEDLAQMKREGRLSSLVRYTLLVPYAYLIIIACHLFCALNMLFQLKGAGHCTSIGKTHDQHLDFFLNQEIRFF